MSSECVVRWRPSGGRGEYEVTPAKALVGKEIHLRVDQLGIEMPTETFGTISQGKPRLRKNEPNNRKKLHLVPLVMAIAKLPRPAREDKSSNVLWPLEDAGFIVSHMGFKIIEASDTKAVLVPVYAQILHSDKKIDLQARFKSIAEDINQIPEMENEFPDLCDSLKEYKAVIDVQQNSTNLTKAVDKAIESQTKELGKSNAISLSAIKKLPPTPFEEDIKGKEGRILTRLHSYRERDKKLVRDAKKAFKEKHGFLFCECCGLIPGQWYGERGENRIQAHHITPVEELLPDTETAASDLVMVCPNCHDLIHAKRPWMNPEDLHEQLLASGNHFFNESD